MLTSIDLRGMLSLADRLQIAFVSASSCISSVLGWQ